MKRVYLIRHGKADDYDPARHGGDSDRALTDAGRAELATIGKQLRRIDPKIEIVLTSPLVRARETGDILARALDVSCEVWGELDPPMAPARLLQRVRARAEARLALVGHEPGMGLTLGRWISGLQLAIHFKKGAIARVDVGEKDSDGPNDLVWLATPEVLGAR